MYNRNGAPVTHRVHERAMAALARRAGGGSGIVSSPSALLGHLHCCATSEEVGESQPVQGAGFDLAFDGRLDNRDELIRELGVAPWGAERSTSDAALAAAAYERWAQRCFERFLGPFALVVVDHRRHRVVCARDHLGDRTLVYHLDRDVLVAASEEVALLAHPTVSNRLDEGSLAAFLAVRPPESGATFFAHIRELPPAHALIVDAERVQLRRYWDLDPEPVRYRKDDDYVEHFRDLLRETVRCRVRSASRCAVQMSGGMDSTSVAALAAQESVGRQRPAVISWVFEDFPAADERPWIGAVVENLGLDAVQIRGDDAWPLNAGESWASNPNVPVEDLYRTLQRRTYESARASGAATLLSGGFGDHLFWGSEYWLLDSLRQGRWADVGLGLLRHAWWHWVRRLRARVPLRTAVSRLLGLRRGGPREPSWLTPRGLELLPDEPPAHSARDAERRARRRLARDRLGVLGVRADRFHASSAGIDHRRPYHDRRLLEFLAAIPACLLHRPGWSKWILRESMRGLLPEKVRTRRQSTTLRPLAVRGLMEREWSRLRRILRSPNAVWPEYVRPEWLWDVPPGMLKAGRDGIQAVVLWRCVCLESWRSRHRYGH